LIRLFVTAELAPGAQVEASEAQAHYLAHVMRLAAGDELRLFNGRNGEWAARVADVRKRSRSLDVVSQVRAQETGPDLDLVVALVKRQRLETIVEKAAELGARRVRLAVTERTNAERTNVARLTSIAIEAAEQTGRLDVPQIEPPQKLDRLLGAWAGERALMFCDEAGEALPALEALKGLASGPWGILIGPEGGFSAAERARIRQLAAAVPVSLGPRILRADTAAIAALALWQASLGDWRGA
jgi:16S rRNA (uracil1498-N3)-methyltransferase